VDVVDAVVVVAIAEAEAVAVREPKRRGRRRISLI